MHSTTRIWNRTLMDRSALVRRAAKLAALSLGVRRRDPRDLTVLLYHRVGIGDREIDVPTGDFEQQIASLAATERVLSLDDALSEPRGGVVVTIDDGFRDFSEIVVPILERHRVPVTLYLATGLVANGSSGPDSLTWRDLEDAVATGLITVGAHTHNHADLSMADETTADEEMRRSKEMIEDRLSVGCRHFSYPWSFCSPDADRVARRLFTSAALPWRTNRRGVTDPHRLGRTPILRNDTPMFFRAKVHGRLDGEAFVYRALRKGPWKPA